MADSDAERHRRPHQSSKRISKRMPANSLFYEKIIPILLAVLALGLLIVLVVVAGAVLGVFPGR